MDFTKILAAGLVVMLAAGGVVASGAGVNTQAATDGTSSVTNADVYATHENGTVTLTLVDEGDGVANATVDVEREYQGEYSDNGEEESDRVGTTDANGTIAFALNPGNESRNGTSVEVEFEKGQFNAELEYTVENDSLSLIEEEYEYEEENENEAEEHAITADNISLSEENATNIATAEANGSVQEIELENEDGTPVYEVELVTSDGSETEVVINANDGTVLETETEAEENEEEENEQEENEQEENEQEENEQEEDESVVAGEVSLSEEDATSIATAEANGSVQEIELENEDGTPVYEVELVTSDGSETEVVVDANDGTVLDTE